MTDIAEDKPKRKNGRPRIEIDWKVFDNLCAIHCTLEEIAGWFNCSEDTIERTVKREKKLSFADYYKTKAGAGNISLRRKQFKQAEEGNVTMSIWLGKQWLGQADKLESKSDDTVLVKSDVDTANYTTEELQRLKAIHETANARRSKQGPGGT
jgi:hypothetical protein